MNPIETEAIYDQGTLKILSPLPLLDGERVRITIHSDQPVKRRRGLIDWKGSAEDLHYLILSDENSSQEAP